MKKTFAILLLLLALAVPVSAKDVYITTMPVGGGTPVEVYAQDETVTASKSVYRVTVKYVYPERNWNTAPVVFHKHSGGWQVHVGEKGYGYVHEWPEYLLEVFDWVVDQI
ncbi:MAG: hypothetical protein E7201_04955 [Selenomonas ruminantium]|jgi:acetyl esterase/lipase|uniref:Uncharacterized protein n=1 Tax=Selenomonas ruminantium TaxID=971 RepID=A0A927WQ93_SELRU|nr:hypothetical protein [Selenomonas ruminantium]